MSNYNISVEVNEVAKMLVNSELLNIIRRAAATQNNYDLAETVRRVLEIPETEK